MPNGRCGVRRRRFGRERRLEVGGDQRPLRREGLQEGVVIRLIHHPSEACLVQRRFWQLVRLPVADGLQAVFDVAQVTVSAGEIGRLLGLHHAELS